MLSYYNFRLFKKARESSKIFTSVRSYVGFMTYHGLRYGGVRQVRD